MEKKDILTAVEKALKEGPKRNFKQTVETVLNLKEIDIKNPAQKVDLFIQLPHQRSKITKVCALVDEALVLEAKKVCDFVITKDEFAKMGTEKQKFKKIMDEHGFFITQPHLMAEVAKAFGKILGPKGKMPNPKAGCIIPPKAPLQPIVDRLRKTVRLSTKGEASIKVAVGDESSNPEDIADNILTVFNAVAAVLPIKDKNIKVTYVKTTMGSPVKVGGAQ